jgi:hypothetical protein
LKKRQVGKQTEGGEMRKEEEVKDRRGKDGGEERDKWGGGS